MQMKIPSYRCTSWSIRRTSGGQFPRPCWSNRIVITKLDGTARGGGALSAVATTGAPVMYIGTGEKVADLEKFESDRFISRLLGWETFVD